MVPTLRRAFHGLKTYGCFTRFNWFVVLINTNENNLEGFCIFHHYDLERLESYYRTCQFRSVRPRPTKAC